MKQVSTKDCHLYAGYVNNDGYGCVFQYLPSTRKVVSNPAHRVSYEHKYGKIPEGLHLDHLCRVRHCINPEHLEAVLPRVNTLRGYGVGAINARKTHCVNGHEFTQENTRICKIPTIHTESGIRTRRRCKICFNISRRKRRAKKRIMEELAKEHNGFVRLVR